MRTDVAESGAVDVTCLDHPLAAAWVTELRDETSGPDVFRRACARLAAALAWEGLRGVAVDEVEVRTPLAATRGALVAGPPPLVVPVLRAGIWMVGPVLDLSPAAEVAMVGLARDEHTLVATTYLDKLPPTIEGRDVLLLDPMLATGGSLVSVGERLDGLGTPRSVTVLALIAAPEGIARVGTRFPEWRLVVAAVDDHLNEHGFIVPGLGDAGDRLSG